MRDFAVRWSDVAFVAAYVVGSSVLGLCVPIAFGGPRAFFWVWGQSVVSDLVFVVGSAGVAVGAARLARASGVLSVLVAAVATWVLYTVSFSLLGGVSGEFDAPGSNDVLMFVGRVGWPGIAFGALAPMIVTRMRSTATVARPGTTV